MPDGANEIDFAEKVSTISAGGNCPVQAFGTVLEHSWYFRARGNAWSLAVGPSDPGEQYVSWDDAIWTAEGMWGGQYEAGWMPWETAEAIIRQALTRFIQDPSQPWYAPDDHLYGEGPKKLTKEEVGEVLDGLKDLAKP